MRYIVYNNGGVSVIVVAMGARRATLIVCFIGFYIGVCVILGRDSTALTYVTLSFSTAPFSVSTFVFSDFSTERSSRDTDVSATEVTTLTTPSATAITAKVPMNVVAITEETSVPSD